jgi:Probable lipoprotein LpqN
MSQIARSLRLFGGGLVAGVIGVGALAGATASADPALPTPPSPAVTAPGAVASPASPGTVNNRGTAPQPVPYPAAAPVTAGAGATPGVAGTAPAATPAPPSAVVAPVSGTLRDYLQSKGVKLVAQKAAGFKALDITLPLPPRWTQVPDPNVPDAFAVIADRLGTSLYTSNAQVVVYKLVGNFDPKEAITHGLVDSQQLLAWQTTNASLSDFDGFPSSNIEGTFRQDDMALNTSRRHVIATSGSDKYLVSFSVTTALSSAVGDAPATDAIINGFRVSAPGTATGAAAGAAATAPAPTPAAAPVGLPAQPPATTPAGAPAQAAAAAAPVGTPGLTGFSGAAPASGQSLPPQPSPNLLALVPGLPPLPNLHLNLLGSSPH